MIWDRCPKTHFCGRKHVRLAVADATIVYNDGICARFDIFERLNMPIGVYTKQCFMANDKCRVKKKVTNSSWLCSAACQVASHSGSR